MKTICTLLVFTLISSIAFAQQSAVEAYAKGDDTHLLFSAEGYQKSKDYVLISIAKKNSSDVTMHKDQFNSIHKNLKGAENVKVLNIDWTTQDDLQNGFDQFGVKVEVGDSKTVRIMSNEFNLSTSSPNAFFLIEGKSAALVCSGEQCEKTLNKFFESSN